MHVHIHVIHIFHPVSNYYLCIDPDFGCGTIYICIYSSLSLSHQPTLRQSIMSPEFQQAKTKGRKGVSKVKVGWFEKGWLDWMVVLIGIRVYGLLL